MYGDFSLWTKIQLTERHYSTLKALLSYVFSWELRLGALLIWLLPLRWERCNGRDDNRAVGSGFGSRTQHCWFRLLQQDPLALGPPSTRTQWHWVLPPAGPKTPLYASAHCINVYLLHYSITPPLNINKRSLINKDDWLPHLIVMPIKFLCRFLLWFKFTFQNKLMRFFYVVQKLDNDNFFTFQVGLNFLIKTGLILCFENSLKIIFKFFFCFKLMFLLWFGIFF